MKYLIPLLAFFLSCSLSTFAQRGFNAGVSAMFNNSWILNQNNFETLDQCNAIAKSELAYRFKFGYSVGAVLGYNFNRKYGLQTSINYNKAGQRYKDTFQPGATCPDPYTVERIVDLRYIQIPLHFKYKFDAGKNFRMYTLVGPQIGFLTGVKEEVTILGEKRTDLTDPNEKFNKFDWGVSIGAGTEYFFTENLYVNLGLMAYYGIADANGARIKQLEWFSKNDVSYQSSHNFRVGLIVGVHYLFSSSGPFKDKGDKPVVPGTTN